MEWIKFSEETEESFAVENSIILFDKKPDLKLGMSDLHSVTEFVAMVRAGEVFASIGKSPEELTQEWLDANDVGYWQSLEMPEVSYVIEGEDFASDNMFMLSIVMYKEGKKVTVAEFDYNTELANIEKHMP